MKVIALINQSDESIRLKFMTGSGVVPLTDFPAMNKTEAIDGIALELPEIILFSPNYVKIGERFFRVICTVLGDASEVYITEEKGQIVDFYENGFLRFINITQLQQVSAKMGIALKN